MNKPKKEVYDQFTFNSKNPLARFAHRSRYQNGLSLIPRKEHLKVLDIGCGDGRFLNEVLKNEESAQLLGYDPYMDSALFPKIQISKEWSEVDDWMKQKGKFDVIVCFEVLEHLNPTRQIEILEKAKMALKEGGVFIVSVPIEKGIPSVIKNLRRIMIHYDAKIYNFRNVVASFFGYKTKWMKQHRKESFYLSHMGFFFDDLEKVIAPLFNIESRVFSPFKKFNAKVNSQVFYVLNKK